MQELARPRAVSFSDKIVDRGEGAVDINISHVTYMVARLQLGNAASTGCRHVMAAIPVDL